MAVGEEDGCGAEPVLGEHVAQRLLDPDAGVDDDALLPRCRGEDVAVGVEGGGGKGDAEDKCDDEICALCEQARNRGGVRRLDE